MIQDLIYPFTPAKVRKLSIGDRVRVSGTIVTGRDRLHEYLYRGGRSPVKLKSGAIYHCGPVVVRENRKWVVMAAGPTTSMREELFMPSVIQRHGIKVIIGKGGMGAKTLAACAKYGCAYLHAIGGAAQVLAEKIKAVSGVYFLNEFGATEAMWILEVKDLPAVVTMDVRGNSLHELIAKKSLRALSKDTVSAKSRG